MWLGEQITERGLGNGISLIIFAGIAAGLPTAIGSTLELARTRRIFDSDCAIACCFGRLRLLRWLYLLSVARRKILVNYAKRQVGNKVYGGQSFPFATEAKYGWCDSTDFCVKYYFIPGNSWLDGLPAVKV